MYALCNMIRTEPSVTACVRRMGDNCLTNDVALTEGGAELASPLRRVIQDHYAVILRQAVEVALLTGFVPFYLRRQEGVVLPWIPELGSFVWTVEQINKRGRDDVGLLRYRVRMLAGDVKDEDMFIVNWHSPQINPSIRLYSPIRYLYEAHVEFRKAQVIALEKERWNTHKHIVVSEKLDLKDPTPSGIQLLDDMRKYSLTGQHNMMRDAMSSYYSRRDKAPLQSVVDANHLWVNEEFSKDPSSAQAVPHIMPPNSLTEELTALGSTDVLPQLREQYHNAVHVFFNGLNMPVSGAKYVGAGGSEIASRAQHVSVLGMCKFLQGVAETMYAQSFGVPRSVVRCTLTPRSRLEITGADDIKVLVECGVLTPADKARIRKMYIGGASMDV
jgi:hypothetical protein